MTTLVLFRGLAASIPEILTLVLGFLVICVGIVLLQISKSAPQEARKLELERHSTFLAWSPTQVSEEKVDIHCIHMMITPLSMRQSIYSLPPKIEQEARIYLTSPAKDLTSMKLGRECGSP